MKIVNTERTDREYLGVAIGCVHNVGAGGVMPCGCLSMIGISDKRFEQFIHRTDRAIGYPINKK